MATIKDVAEAAGVSFKTVSRVINNEPNVRDEVRQRVLRAIDKVDYRQNLAAKVLRTQKSQVIGLITDRIATTPYASHIVKGAQDAAWRAGKMLIIINTDGEESVEEAAVDTLIKRQVEGIIFATVHHRLVNPPKALLSIPSVLVDCYAQDHCLPSMVPDEVRAGYTATKLLLEKGHRRVGFINGRADFPAAKGRLKGYKKALKDFHLAYDTHLVRDGGWWQQDGYENTSSLMSLPKPPSAIFCASDRIAMGAYDALRELGLKIPDDVAIIGFDNHEIIAAHLRPSLTTMELPYYAMGKWGIHYLLEHKEDPSTVPAQEMLECPPILRKSI
jgi:LacI family transcriptional regulator